MLRVAVVVSVCVLGSACLQPTSENRLDGGLDGGLADSGLPAVDGGAPDAGPVATPDSGMVDSGAVDAGQEDAGATDGGPLDAGTFGTCANPIFLAPQQTFAGGYTTTVRATAIEDQLPVSCSTSVGGAEAVYAFELTNLQDLSVTTSAPAGTTVNVSVREIDCLGAELRCTHLSPTGSAAVQLTALTAGRYILIVEFESGPYVDVTVRVSKTLLPATNDDCGSAEPVQFVNGVGLISGNHFGSLGLRVGETGLRVVA